MLVGVFLCPLSTVHSMEFKGKEVRISGYATQILMSSNLSEACHLRAVLQDRQDASMQGSPLFTFLHQLNEKITEAQSNVNTYTELLSDIDQKQRDKKLQTSLQIAKENVNVSN